MGLRKGGIEREDRGREERGGRKQTDNGGTVDTERDIASVFDHQMLCQTLGGEGVKKKKKKKNDERKEKRKGKENKREKERKKPW